MTLSVRAPLAPMLAKLTRAIPVGDYVYEPKWDGFRALVFRDGDAIEVWSRAEKRLDRYFPEIGDAMRALPETRFVVDGEIVVVSGGALDFAALMARLHPTASRVARLRSESPALFIAFDVLAIGDVDLRSAPFERRRIALERLLGPSPRPGVVLTPSTTRRIDAERWLRGAGAGIDGVVAKARSLTYEPGKRAMIKVKTERTADCVVAGMRLLQAGPSVGSLLLGLAHVSRSREPHQDLRLGGASRARRCAHGARLSGDAGVCASSCRTRFARHRSRRCPCPFTGARSSARCVTTDAMR